MSENFELKNLFPWPEYANSRTGSQRAKLIFYPFWGRHCLIYLKEHFEALRKSIYKLCQTANYVCLCNSSERES